MKLKQWFALAVLFAWAPILPAQVILPASGRLAGPLNSQVSEMGDELFNIPDFFVAPLPAAGVELNGWVEIQFAEPQGDTVDFSMHYRGRGAPGVFPFPGGQIYLLFGAQTINQPIPSTGTLDLITGEVTNLQVNAFFPQSLMSGMGRLNRFAPLLPGFYPFPDFGLQLGPFPPGFFANEASFTFDAAGRISGFQFRGRTTFPLATLGKLNAQLQFFPLHAFGPESNLFVHNPFTCLPGTPPEVCPNDEDNPDGIPFPDDFFLHPHVFMRSDELREVPAERTVPSCGPVDVYDGVLVSAAGRLYHIGGTRGSSVIARVDVYDPALGQWQPGSPLPTAVTEAQGAAIGSTIYVIGGRRKHDGPAVPLVQILDTETGVWSQGSEAPIPVARGAVAVFGEAIYLLAGKTNRPNGSPTGNLKFNDVGQIYFTAADSWSDFPLEFNSNPIYAESASALLVGRDIYLMGGRTPSGVVTPRVWLYDVLTGSVRRGSDLQVAVYDAAAGFIGKRIFVAGGRQAIDGPSRREVQFLNAGRTEPPRGASSLWLAGHDMPFPVASSAAAVLGGELYVVGGRTLGSDALGAPSRAVQAFDPGRGWQACGSQPLFNTGDVFNIAALGAGSRTLSPGSLATLTGHNLANQNAIAPAEASVPTELGGVRLTVDGLPAPILAVSPERVDFQVPYGVTTGGPVELTLVRADIPQQAPPIEVSIGDVSPGIFVQNCGVIEDVGYLDEAAAIACNDDGTLNYAANPVRQGEVVTIQMTGLGAVTPALANGERAPADPVVVANVMPTVTVRGEDGEPIEATVLSATLAPGEVGIYDVRIEVPAGSLIANRVRVQATVDDAASNRAVISVGEPTTDTPQPCRRDTDPEFRSCIGPALADLF